MSSKGKVLIVYPVDFKENQNRGIYEKMVGQGEAFMEIGFSVKYAFIEGKNCVIQNADEKTVIGRGVFHGWTKYKRFFDDLQSEIDNHEYQVLYVRHLVFSTPLFQFLSEAKRTATRIVYEFPCWPYEKEWKKGIGSILISIDQRNRDRCLHLVDLVVHFGGFNLTDIPNLQLSNGIAIQDYFQSEKARDKSDDLIKLIAVGKWAHWHGLDRVIRSLKDNQSFHLDVIGEGPASNGLKRLGSKVCHNQIKFHGKVFGPRLSELLLNSDVAIGTLGIHRKGVALNSSLKHRLYCAHGLPFILSSFDPDFQKDWPFCYYEETNDVPIDLKKIEHWYAELLKNYPNYRFTLRDYTKENLSWRSQINTVVSQLFQ